MFIRFKQKTHNLSITQSSRNVALLLLAAVLVGVSFSLFASVITWILLLVTCGAVLRVEIYYHYYRHLPSTRALNLLAVLSTLGLIYTTLNTDLLFGMVNLLILACALKLMQMHSQKDVYQLVISLFFLMGYGLVFNQSIGFSLFYALMCLLLLLSLACYHAPSITIQKHLKTVSILSVQALLVSLLMFLVLPQLPPLWHTLKINAAKTGLSEQITPGDIAALSQSSELAFRATFSNALPTPQQRYWRVIVMEDFDGKTWKVHPYRRKMREFQLQRKLQTDLRAELRTGPQKKTRKRQPFMPTLTGPFFSYEVMAEPNYQSWLFAIGIAVPTGPQNIRDIISSDDFLLFNRRPVTTRYQYTVRSYYQALASQTLTETDRQINLTLPENGNPQIKQWIAKLRQQFKDNNHFTKAVLRHFIDNPFVYTLRPNVMLVDPVDRFLFDEQAGFCGHYAGALAYALRLGGIPTRLVTGYQGGESVKNIDGSAYLSVYQYDAHAWVETWNNELGWQRIDPTALVSPDRIELGLRQVMQEEGSFLADSPFALARLGDITWLNDVRLFLVNIDYHWSRWVLGFNGEKQRDLFKSILGKLTPERLSLLGLGLLFTVSLLLGLFFVPHYLKNRLSTTQRLYLASLSAFEKAGTARAIWQGPSDFSQQISKHYSHKVSEPFFHITQHYLRLTYRHQQACEVSAPSTTQCHRMMRRHLAQLKTQLSRIKHKV